MPTPETIRQTPDLRWAAGERAEVAVPVTLPAGRTLAEFGSFELYIWADPDWVRAGAKSGLPLDPAVDGWALAATLAGAASGSTVTFVGVLPSESGFRRYVLAAWALGGTAGPTCLVYPTWLTLVPGR